jgi:hypothetical protein
MLNLAIQPATVDYTLAEHRGIKDPPVFTCRPLSVAEGSEVSGEITRAQELTGSSAPSLIGIFKKHIVSVSQLQVDGKAFDPKDPTHLEAIGYNAMIEVGGFLYYRSGLTEIEAGK